MITAGIDIGTRSAKAVILNGHKILASEVRAVNNTVHKVSCEILKKSLQKARVSKWKLSGVVSTGYGAGSVKIAKKKLPSPFCIAKAVNYIDKNINYAIDIGGLITSSISIGRDGCVIDYLENEKCASGSGRFLEMISDALEIGIEDIGPLSLMSNTPLRMSRQCIVFAESEVISHVNSGEEPADILAGLHKSIAERAVSQIKRMDFSPPLAITGGVAKNTGIVHYLEKFLDTTVFPIKEDPQIMGAIGAALLAANR